MPSRAQRQAKSEGAAAGPWAARDFLDAHPNERPVSTGGDRKHTEVQVAKFLDWDMHRVMEALAELDATMIKIMADENDEVYNLSPAVINETVKAARDFLRTHPKEIPAAPGRGKRGMEVPIAKFLDWDVERVKEALAELAAIDAGQLEQQAVEQMPSQKAAETFRKQVRIQKTPLRAQRRAAPKEVARALVRAKPYCRGTGAATNKGIREETTIPQPPGPRLSPNPAPG